MAITYQICYLESVVRKHIPALSSSAKELIKRAIEEPWTTDRIGLGKALR